MFSSTVEIFEMTVNFKEFPSIIVFFVAVWTFSTYLEWTRVNAADAAHGRLWGISHWCLQFAELPRAKKTNLKIGWYIFVPWFVSILPDHDNCKIEYIPRVAEVRIWMRYKSIRYDFHCTFTRENDCENNFYFFLQFDYFNPFSFNVIPDLTKNSLIAVESPLGEGWNTARHKHVPQMAIRMKASNDFHSTISNNFFLTGFLSPMHQRA